MTVVVILDGYGLMPAGSTRRVPAVSSGALYRRSTPRTRSSVTLPDETLPDEALPDETLSGRVAAAARTGVAEPMPYKTGSAASPPRTPRRLRVPSGRPPARS